MGEGIGDDSCGVGVWVRVGSRVNVAGEEFEKAGEAFVEIWVEMGVAEGDVEYEETIDGEDEGVSVWFLNCLSPGGNDSVRASVDTIATARMTQAINFRLNRMPFPK